MTVDLDRVSSEFRGAGEVVTDAEILESYRRDQASEHFLDAGVPAVVVRPRTTEQVQAAVRAAARLSMPVLARGAGSGLTGGANAIDGCVVISLERMTDIVRVDAESLTATVQAGVLNSALREAVAAEGLWYAPDPASADFSTIGGNVATNAGGLCCVKYGVTRDWVLGLEVVLADGSVVRIGRQARKGVAGYDLVALMCGSEGTLGIITEVTVRLQPLPRSGTTVAASFPELGDAGRAIGRVMRGLTPSILEIMDAGTIAAVEAFQPMDLDRDAAAMVFACSDAGTEESRREAQLMAQWFEEAGASIVVVSEDEAEARMLMAARRLAYPALERLGATLLDDVALPLKEIPRFLEAVAGVAHHYDLTIGTFGHAGDGNMHPTVVYDPSDPAQTREAVAAFETLLTLARDLGGTIAGEHGVGVLKREALLAELGNAHALHVAIKRALDPADRLNPGKAI